MQRSPDGTRLGDLADAYPGAADDAAALASEGRLWLMPGSDRFDGVVFPRAPPPMPVSAAVAAQWHLTEARAHFCARRTRQLDQSVSSSHSRAQTHHWGCVRESCLPRLRALITRPRNGSVLTVSSSKQIFGDSWERTAPPVGAECMPARPAGRAACVCWGTSCLLARL